jgi:hypothetical protein
MTIYISGPISGVRDNNRSAFEKARKKIIEIFEDTELWDDLTIINPQAIGGAVEAEVSRINERRHHQTKPQWEDYMRRCLPAVCSSDYILLLGGWSYSRGATLEKYVADEIGIPVFSDAVDLFKAAMEKWRAA